MEGINLNNYEAYLLDYCEGNLDYNQIIELKKFITQHSELEINLEDLNLPEITISKANFQNKDQLKKIIPGSNDDLIIAYLENLLSSSQKLKFEARLLTDKNLKAELEAYSKTILSNTVEKIPFDKKQLLKTEDDLLMSNPHLNYLEGLFTQEERSTFENELNHNPALLNENIAYQNTYLLADNNEIFPNKIKLRREPIVISIFNQNNLIRFAAAILLLIGFYFIYPLFITSNKNNAKSLAIIKKNNTPVKQKINSTKTLIDTEKVPTRFVNSEKNKPNTIRAEKILQDSTNYQNIQNKVFAQKSVLNDTLNNLTASNTNTSNTAFNQVDSLSQSENTLINNKTIYTLANIESENENEETNSKPINNGFWSKLINLTNKAKRLGIKGVEAEQKENNTYLFAFNNLTIEKK